MGSYMALNGVQAKKIGEKIVLISRRHEQFGRII